MNIYHNKIRQSSFRFFLFPLFSFLFHLLLFLSVKGLEMDQSRFEIKEDELVTMVDLGDLPDFREIQKPPEPVEEEPLPLFPSPEFLSPTVSDIGEVSPDYEQDEGLPISETEETAPPDQEALEDFDEEESVTESAPESADEPEVLMADAEPSPEPELEPEEVPLAESEDESSPETAPLPTISGREEAASEPESEPEPESQKQAPESESSPTSTAGVSGEDGGKLLQEVSAGAAADAGLPASDSPLDERASENSKIIKPPPPAKPSREKIKRVGLLGMLGKTKGVSLPERGKALLSKGLNQPRGRFAKTVKHSTRSAPSQSKQKIAMLKQSTVSSEQKRLMQRKNVRRRRQSGIKIIHGSGRNYGIISSAIEKKRGRLTTVYSSLLQRNPDLQGNLIIEFTISSQGKVIKSQILTSSLGNTRFEKALIQEIRLWKFPSTERGETTTVLYPLSFFPSS